MPNSSEARSRDGVAAKSCHKSKIIAKRLQRPKLLIERSEKCGASLSGSGRVRLADTDGGVVWDGIVSTFDLHNHKDGIRRAYAWEIPATIRAREPKYHFVLGKRPINSPQDAVKAYIVTFYRSL